MSDFQYFLLAGGIAIVLGIFILMYLNKCRHNWLLIESGGIFRERTGNLIGFTKVYECVHCKKMKKEQIKIN
jgi:hypothetical protein